MELVLLVALPLHKDDSKCAVALFDALVALAPTVRVPDCDRVDVSAALVWYS